MIRRILDWLEHRTGLETTVKHFLYEDIPASSGWHNVLGSVALFGFLCQVVTGILMALNYAPTPGDAYNSVKYIVTEVAGGRLIRGLHHWGATIMIVTVVMHMTQVFLWGAYKKPREATWIVGVVLLLLTMGYGLTGYLLPWDNRAYWGTVVATSIAAKAPIAGPYLARLLGGQGAIGVVTFARFYAIHVLLLPPLTMLLIGVHVYLVRRHGVAPEAGDIAPAKKFYPEQVYKDTVAMFGAFMILFLLAAFAKVPLEKLADPTDTTYIPRPDWYFLFLFQMLKFFEGSLEIVGSMVLPGLAVGLLFLTPFIDRGHMVKLRQRGLAFGVFLLGAIAWGGLTAAAIISTPKAVEEVAESDTAAPEWAQLPAQELAGIGLFHQENCAVCHGPSAGGTKIAPSLLSVGTRRNAAWMIAHFKRPQQMVPGSTMPPVNLPDAQLNALSAFLLKLTSKSATNLAAVPNFAAAGAMVYQKNNCGACHQVNGVGVKMGPVLNGVGQRRTKEWLQQHFVEPQKMSPGSVMPPYRFTPKEMEDVTAYLMVLPQG